MKSFENHEKREHSPNIIHKNNSSSVPIIVSNRRMRARAGTALVGRRHKRAEEVYAFFIMFLQTVGGVFGRKDVVRGAIWASEQPKRRPKSPRTVL